MHPHIVENSVDIAFTPAYNIKSKVVSCFSPLFYNERWQLILATLEIYKELGVSKQVFYIQSMVSDVFKVLEHYKARGYNEIEPWSKLDIGDLYRNELGYDPNTELDWRNQAAAHTHCFLKYKSAADFIMIGDIDDVLFPKIADNYFDEFLILSQRYPNAAGFTYDRFNTEVTSTKVSSDFSMSRLLDSSVVYNEWEDGKYVVNSSRVSSAWIHWPGIIKNGHTMKLVPRNDNFMLHLRKWKLTESKSGRQQLVHQPKTSKSEKFNIQLGDIINKDVIERIETRWMKNLDTIPGIKHLPTEVRYYPLIANCYNRIFYSIEKRPSSCPGPIKCKLPEIKGLSCTVAQTTFNRHRSKNNYVVHYPESTVFVEKTNGCTL
uniref:Glycosyltransferase family 92 protein n=1 Tax=Rhabditophanes sp. KR3021 TaxID=114890 RepID=A0AC35U784_9BILA